MYIRIDMISLPYLIHVEINDFSFLFYLVGSRNNTPLSEDPFLTSRNTGRFTGRCNNNRKVSKEQTKTHHIWTRRKTGTRTEGCKICGMFSINTGLVYFSIFSGWKWRIWKKHVLFGNEWYHSMLCKFSWMGAEPCIPMVLCSKELYEFFIFYFLININKFFYKCTYNYKNYTIWKSHKTLHLLIWE